MKAIVLGAGKGTRLQSEKYNMPKVLRRANGRPLLEYVLEALSFIPQEDICIVVGYKKEMVKEEIQGNYMYADQDEQLGTGHAVMMAEPYFRDYDGPVLIAYGDMPLYTRETYQTLIQKHIESGSKCTVLTAVDENPPAYGRIIRNEAGEMVDIVETKDCTPEQLQIKELNIGLYVFDNQFLFQNLALLKNDNAQKEYYLTDIPKIMLGKGEKIHTYTIYDTDEIYGVNTPEDLEFCERVLKERRK
ncbi:MAG: NTP transferase domain-containing protein [Epulopiscium sp.]|nr:NTP transferase domain-containing protein [Candidatus Epulonipiscium sp.]